MPEFHIFQGLERNLGASSIFFALMLGQAGLSMFFDRQKLLFFKRLNLAFVGTGGVLACRIGKLVQQAIYLTIELSYVAIQACLDGFDLPGALFPSIGKHGFHDTDQTIAGAHASQHSGLAVVSDLFGDDAYFADAQAFWTAQSAALAEEVEAFKADGWADVVILDRGQWFARWDHCTCAKEDGGKVFVTITHQGEVEFHEGFITHAEAKRREKAEAGETAAPKPELTKATQAYVDLHRHAAVRADMLGQTGLALRLIAAHMIAGLSLWRVEAEPQKAAKPEIEDSLAANTGQQAFEAERAAIAGMLGMDEVSSILERRDLYAPRSSIRTILIRLHQIGDSDVLRVLTFLMAESLDVTSPLIDGIAGMLGTKMRQHWQPDATFFELIRDKQVLNAMVGEFAGEDAAKGNITATAKTQRSILTACLNGTRTAADPNWTPRYMAFPQGSYREDVQASAEPEAVSEADEQREAA